MPPSTLIDWLSYIESQHPSEIELGLERCSSVLNKLPYSRPKQKIITIGGTNGKGSTCAFLTQYFVQTELSVGTFTSPHFLHFNERIAINNKPVSDELICDAFAYIESVREDVPLTYFEFNTLAAIWIFSQANLDYWVLEVGLGGRLDSVNMIDSDMAVVTSISLDHTDWLGDSLDGIAKEKAGIAREGRLFINGVKNPPPSLSFTAEQAGAIVKQKDKDFSYTLNLESNTWCWKEGNDEFANLPIPTLPLENAATSIAVLNHIVDALQTDDLIQLMDSTELLGRFQTISIEPNIIVDVAHNPEAAEELRKRIERLNKPVIALCGMLHDKDIETVLSTLDSSFDAWHLVDLHEQRGAKGADMSPFVKNWTIHNDINNGLNVAIAQAERESKTLLVFGSFVTVGHTLNYFKSKER